MLRPNFTVITFSLLLASFGFWLYSISTSEFVFSTDIFSYFTLLPWTYMVSLLLLITALGTFLLNRQNVKRQVLFDCLIIFIFVLVLFGTPCFVEQTPRMFDAYGHTSSALIVQSTGNAGLSLTAQNIPASAYEVNYPGFFTLIASLLTATGLPWIVLEQYYPIFLMALISFLIYIIARKFSPGFSVLAPVLYLGFAWFEEFHLSPESFSLVLYLVVWLIFIHFLERKNVIQDRAFLIPLLLIFFSITISHAGAPIFILINVAFFLAFGLLSTRFRNLFSKKSMFILFLVMLLLFIAWNLNDAESSFSGLSELVFKFSGIAFSKCYYRLEPVN